MHRKIAKVLMGVCMLAALSCGDSSPSNVSQSCTQSSECPAESPYCNTETGKCEAAPPSEDRCRTSADCQDSADGPYCNTETGKCEAAPPSGDRCTTSADCKNSDAGICNEAAGKCVECLRNNDCTDDARPRCIAETGRCESAAYGKKSCQTSGDCTDSYYSECNLEIHECTSPCTAAKDCRICGADDETCVDTDVPVCNHGTQLCEAYSDCSVSSAAPCYTKCSEEGDEYFAWLNGGLVSQKCRDNSCSVTAGRIGANPDTCEPYNTPPASCNSETSASLCSPSGESVWYCDGSTNTYFVVPCDSGTTHCVQCQNRAGCIANENCTGDSARICNPVCNPEGDGYYIWDDNADGVRFRICPEGDCVHKCGTAECSGGLGYMDGDLCGDSLKYCTKDGSMAVECAGGVIVQRTCKNSDCAYDAEKNEITACTSEQL